MTKPRAEQSIRMMRAVNELRWKSHFAGAILLMGVTLFVVVLVLLCKGKFREFGAGAVLDAILMKFGWQHALDHFIPNKKSPQVS